MKRLFYILFSLLLLSFQLTSKEQNSKESPEGVEKGDIATNLLDNGNFESGTLPPWYLFASTTDGASASTDVSEAWCTVQGITLAGSPAAWQIQLIQSFYASQLAQMSPNDTLIVSFDAFSEINGRPCNVYFGMDEPPWSTYLLQDILINTTVSTYTFECVIGSVFSSIKFAYGLGHHSASVTFDNITIKKKTPEDTEYTPILEWEHQYPESLHIGDPVSDRFLLDNIDEVYIQGSDKVIVFDQDGALQVSYRGITQTLLGNTVRTEDLYNAVPQEDPAEGAWWVNTYRKGAANWSVLQEHAFYYLHPPDDRAIGIAIDDAEYIYVVADYSGLDYYNHHKYATIKLRGSDGHEEWEILSDEYGKPYDMVIDNSANIYVTGSIGTFVYDRWSQQICNCEDEGSIIEVDEEGNFYLGNYIMTTSYDPYDDWAPYWHRDIEIAKFNSMCVEQWREAYTESPWGDLYNDDNIHKIIFDQDAIYISSRNGTRLQDYDSFIAKYDKDGNFQWVEKGLHVYDMTTDNQGNLYALNYSTLYKIDPQSGEVIWEIDNNYSTGLSGIYYSDDILPVSVMVDAEYSVYTGGTFNNEMVVRKYSQKPDTDGDGVPNDEDNCPLTANAGQEDGDADGVGNVCDNCVSTANSGQEDGDGDGEGDACDNCPNDYNDQQDTDSDGIGDVCDNCSSVWNYNQEDDDEDGYGNVCDNCPSDPNSGQQDRDGDGIGNVCDPDDDGDGVPDVSDNCPFVFNPLQEDFDGDGVGDECNDSFDADGDEISDYLDNCPDVENPDQADHNENGIGDACEFDLSVSRVEVTQVIQDQDNSVPLILGKDTWIRIYFDVGQANDTLGPIWGRLSFTTSDPWVPMLTYTEYESLPIDVMVNSYNTINAVPNPKSANKGHTLNFRIPGNWRWDGNPYVQITVYNEDPRIDIESRMTMVEAFPLILHDVSPLNIAFVPVSLYEPITFTQICDEPDENDFWNAAYWVLKSYPISKINARKVSLGYVGDPTQLDLGAGIQGFGLWMDLLMLSALTNSPLPNTYYHGLVCEGVPCEYNNELLNCSVTGMGFMGISWSAYGGNSLRKSMMAHEMGHSVRSDISHVEDTCGAMWPFFTDFTGTSYGKLEAGVYGFDGNEVYPWYEHFDLMTYCSPQWMSTYTYKKLYEVLSNKTFKENKVVKAKEFSYFMISGIIVNEDYIENLRIQMNAVPIEIHTDPGNEEYSVVQLNGSDEILHEQPFEAQNMYHGQNIETFYITVPYYANTTTIQIRLGSEIIEELSVSTHIPQVQITYPNGTENLSGNQTITWTASDSDGDDLLYDILYSADNGENWSVLVLNYSSQSYDWNTEDYPGGDNSVIRVVVSDGANTAYDDSDAPFTVETKAPEVFIYSPENNSNQFLYRMVTLEGTADDMEDGSVHDSLLIWTSNIDGHLGKGHMITVDSLTAGTHLITLNVTDSDENSGSASISLIVLADEDSDGDGIGDDVDDDPYVDNTATPSDLDDCVPDYTSDTANILYNGSFDICFFDPWFLYTFDWEGVTASMDLIDGSCKITPGFLAPEPLNWHIQLVQELTSLQRNNLEAGGTYELYFDAYAETADRQCNVFFGLNEAPYTPYISQLLLFDTDITTYQFEFQVDQVYPVIKISFDLGTSTSAITIDNVRIIKKIVDSDGDGIEDSQDNCPLISNYDQDDTDNDNVGDICDNCPNDPNTSQTDSDGDGIGDACDEVVDIYSVTPRVIQIFPNPATEYLGVKTEQGSEIRLYNGLGVLIKSEISGSGYTKLNVSYLPKGIYVIEVTRGNYVSLHRVVVR
ncbi:MAG: thrombospondin type 3 repeat-containing protein [Bacteroidales bacterium]|nr:thrombospondin type 3 repeat-containing protein [Bacteroidales bacterium]